MAEIITLTDMTYAFETTTTFLLKKIKIITTEEMEVYPMINEFNLISVHTNKESEVYLEPLTTQNILMRVIGHYDRPVNVLSIELEILKLLE